MLEALTCLALNIYYEARNQSVEAQIAVSQVVINRVRDDRFPDNICDVIMQAKHSKITGKPLLNKCQFSWYCDGKTDKPHDLDAYRWAQIIAKHVSEGKSGDMIKGSTHYHASYVTPDWAKNKTKTVKIGDHIFYRWEK